MLLTQPRHAARFTRGRAVWAWVRAWDDWREITVLRTVLPLILVAVSAYYLTIWGHENGLPWGLAWTVPVALDLTAWAAVRVALHAKNRPARWYAVAVAWLCVLASAAGNIGAHVLELGYFAPNLWSISATVSVFPICLFLGMTVIGGMAPRPLTADEQAARDLQDAHTRQERLAVEARGRAERRSIDAQTDGDTGPIPAVPAPAGRVSHIGDQAPKQERSRAFILGHVGEHGRAPTAREVDAHVGGKSGGRVLAAMRKAGEIPAAA